MDLLAIGGFVADRAWRRGVRALMRTAYLSIDFEDIAHDFKREHGIDRDGPLREDALWSRLRGDRGLPARRPRRGAADLLHHRRRRGEVPRHRRADRGGRPRDRLPLPLPRPGAQRPARGLRGEPASGDRRAGGGVGAEGARLSRAAILAAARGRRALPRAGAAARLRFERRRGAGAAELAALRRELGLERLALFPVARIRLAPGRAGGAVGRELSQALSRPRSRCAAMASAPPRPGWFR